MKIRKTTIALYVAPSLIMITLFLYIPVLINGVNSLFRFGLLNQTRSFTGLENFKRLFSDEVFYISLKNNISFMLISSVFQIGFSLIIAGILDHSSFRKWQRVFRTIYFLPSLLMVTVVGLVFRILYSPSIGLVNPLLELMRISHENLDLLGNASTAIYAVIVMSQWQYIGFTVMLFCVAMQSIPSQLLEAAEIDGAGAIRKFIQVILPQIRSTIAINWIIIISGSIKVFDEVFVTTSGGPGRATETLATFLYRSGFKNDEMGYASTIALVLFLGTFILGLIQMRGYQVEEIG